MRFFGYKSGKKFEARKIGKHYERTENFAKNAFIFEDGIITKMGGRPNASGDRPFCSTIAHKRVSKWDQRSGKMHCLLTKII